MKFASKIELGAGVGTIVLAFVSTGFYIIVTRSLGGPEGSVHEVLKGTVLSLGLPMLVAIGSYFHVIRGRIAGLVILLLSGLILTAMGLLGGVILYARGAWVAAPFLLPCLTAALTVIAAVCATWRRRI
jgi:hypothetical protein